MASKSRIAARSRPRLSLLLHLALALTLPGFFPAGALAQNEVPATIRLAKGYNLVGITRTTADNSIASLFPKPPANSLLFTYDNATGYSEVHNMNNSGTPDRWRPESFKLPLGAAVIFMSPVEGFQLELGGILVGRIYRTIYYGPSLSALTKDDFAALRHEAIVGDRIRLVHDGVLTPYTCVEGGVFEPPLPEYPPTGAMWYEGSPSRPAHLSGTFPMRPVVYVNNFVPALNVNLPVPPGFESSYTSLRGYFVFFDGAGNALRAGDYFRISQGAILAESTISERRTLLRYVPPGAVAFGVGLQYRYLGFEEISRPVSVVNLDAFVPVGLNGLSTLPYPGISRARVGWRTQPSDQTVLVGQTANLFGDFGPESGSAIPSQLSGVTASYQWERLNEGKWEEVRGLTSSGYRLSTTALSDAGQYRLRARWAGDFYHSRVARLDVFNAPGPDLRLNTSSAIDVEFPTEIGQSYRLQISTNAQTWSNFGERINGDGTSYRQQFLLEAPEKLSWRLVRLP